MTRRRAAAVVMALLVAGAAWFVLSQRDDVVATAPTETAVSAEASPTPSTVTPTAPATTASKLVDASRPRRRREPSTDESVAPTTTPFKFHGRAVFEDGRSAVGARVRVFDLPEPSDGSSQIGDEVVVGADGRFEIGAMDEERRGLVYGVFPGFAYAGVWESTATDVVLTLVPGGVVTGTVFDAEGRPWAGVEVRLVRCDDRGRVGKPSPGAVWKRPEVAAFYTQSTRTDVEGRYRIGGAPLADKDRHSVAVVEGPDGVSWRSDVATFATSGGELVRDVRVGAKAFDGQDPLRRIEGLVTDAEGRPIEDADIVYGVLDSGTDDEHARDKTDDVGRFSVELGDEFERDGRAVGVRVGSPGYWTWRGAPAKPGEILRVELTRWGVREPRPGRVLVTATDSDDRPLSGRLLIDVEDEFFRARSQCAMADERGEFTLEGLWHGTWRISLDGGRPVEVVIRDGDEVRVRLRAMHDAASLAVKPAPERMTKLLEVQRLRVAELKERKGKLAESGQPKDALDAELESALDDLQQTEAMRRDALPRREVLVTGVPRDGSYVVGAKRDGRTWRVEATDGVARFPSLSTETWWFTIERFGIGTAPRDVDIVEGEGPQTVEVSVPR